MICHTASHPPYLHPSLVGNIFGNFWKIWSTFYFMIWSYCIPPTLPAPIPCWQHFWQLLENLGYFLFHDLVTLHPTHPTYTHPLLATFLATFGKNWATFYFMLWSHCITSTLPTPIPCLHQTRCK